MHKLKKLFGVALAVSLIAFSSPYVHSESENKQPGWKGGGPHATLDFYGTVPKIVTLTTTAALLVGGEGFLDGICPFRGTMGKYTMALDSVASTNLTVDNGLAYAISPDVYTSTASTTFQNINQKCWTPPGGPVKFRYGLVGANSGSDITALFYVHSSSGINPGPR